MTALRQKMIDEMRLRGFSVRTHKSYLGAITDLARYYHRSPDQLTVEQLQAYFLYLVKDRHLCGASCRVYLNAIRFLYLQVLHWQAVELALNVPKQAQRIPELLTRDEVARILRACTNPKHHMMLMVCYGCGLRVSELVRLKVRDIDGQRRLLRIEQGKGAKDRQVILSATLLAHLRRYWQRHRPRDFLFPGQPPHTGLCVNTALRVYQAAKARAQVNKVGGIHALRHAFATHQLEAGTPVHRLQHLLGHRNIQSTLRYVHWVPNAQPGTGVDDLIASLETRP